MRSAARSRRRREFWPRAVDQVQASSLPEEVALGLHRKMVFGWLAKCRDGGRGMLEAGPVPGR
jgi:hypothetical protein